MKTLVVIARILLGLMFVVFGLNKFHAFIPVPPMTGLAAQFMGALSVSRYLLVIGAIEVLGGALLLVNRYVPLGLTLLAPIVVNILLFHSFFEPTGVVFAIVLVGFWLVIFASVRSAFSGLVHANA